MNHNISSTTNDANSAACPLASLVLLAATHHPEDAKELLKPLGVEQPEIDKYAAENAGAIEAIRKTAIAGALLDRNTFASLIRVRVGVKLIETEDPRQLATLVTAAAKLPPWVFGEAEPVVKQSNSKAHGNGGYLDSDDGMPDITTMGMQETIAEAKALIEELEKPGGVHVP